MRSWRYFFASRCAIHLILYRCAIRPRTHIFSLTAALSCVPPQRLAFNTWYAKSTALQLGLRRLYSACATWNGSLLRKGWYTWQAGAAERSRLERIIGYLSPEAVALRKALNSWSAASVQYRNDTVLLQRACVGLTSRLLWGFNGAPACFVRTPVPSPPIYMDME